MNLYTASNGVGLTITRDRTVRWRPGIPANLVSSALREYFQAERDEELGRWRDHKNLDMVCYPVAYDLDAVLVMYEGDMTRYYATRTDWERIRPHYVSETAGRYFAAHPEPKPWDDAEEGDIWVLTRYGAEEPFFVTGGEFTSTDLAVATDLDDPRITDGRRIWPEGENK